MLTAGTRVGHYEIVGPLGSGGMGEVYRASDSKLKRQVAVKVLPAELAADATRLARFRREAEVLASLNHPNIAAIYGLEESDGSVSLVMELVEGPTLEERLDRGALSWADAQPLARQIAAALEAAHERGIVHRDLKPANVKVTADGTVKVLDFGLAAIVQSDIVEASSISNSPTLSLHATQAGVILGTAGYMAPEQASGQRVDKRADIWAFGVVLYELLTGRKLFGGETLSHTLADVLRAPIDLSTLPGSTPTAVRELLRRCLERDPKLRLRDIGEARIVLERPAHVATPATPSRALPWRAIALGLGVTTIAAAAVAVALSFRAPETPVAKAAPTFRFQISPPPGASFNNPFQVSPDGTKVAFGAQNASATSSAIYVRSLDGLTARALPGTESAVGTFGFFWSPDGEHIAFFTSNSLNVVPAAGGPVRVVCRLPDAGIAPGGFESPTDRRMGRGTWNREGVILFHSGPRSPIYRVAASGGEIAHATELDAAAPERHVAPEFLPDGRRFTFLSLSTGREPALFVGQLDSTERTRLPGIGSSVSYSQGHLLFMRERRLFAQAFDPAALRLSGEQVPLTDQATTGQASFSVSQAGTLVVRQAVSRETELAWFDRTGKRLGRQPMPGSVQAPNLSRDGKYLVVEREDGGPPALWVLDLVRGTQTRLTVDPPVGRRPVFSPDGRRVAYSREGKVFDRAASGMGDERLLTEGETTDWSPDGRFLGVFKEADVWAVPLDGDRTPVRLSAGKAIERRVRFSPDGRLIAYESDISGQFEIYVQRFPVTDERWQVSANGGTSAYWRNDGRELFFTEGERRVVAVDITPGATFDEGVPHALFDVDGTINNGRFVVSPDGQRFLVPVLPDDPASSLLTVVLNWTSALPH